MKTTHTKLRVLVSRVHLTSSKMHLLLRMFKFKWLQIFWAYYEHYNHHLRMLWSGLSPVQSTLTKIERISVSIFWWSWAQTCHFNIFLGRKYVPLGKPEEKLWCYKWIQQFWLFFCLLLLLKLSPFKLNSYSSLFIVFFYV